MPSPAHPCGARRLGSVPDPAGEKKAKVAVTVEFTDESGNSAKGSLKLKLK